MNVPYDEWGEEVFHELIEETDDFQKYLNDEFRYLYEEDFSEATKMAVINEILAWRNDDGLWSDDDMSGYIAYKDGKLVDVRDLNGKSFSRKGIIGASVSTPDVVAAWGNEWSRSGGHLHQVPMTITVGEDEREVSNTWYTHVTTGRYRVRVETTYRRGQKYPEYKTVRKSQIKSTGYRGRKLKE